MDSYAENLEAPPLPTWAERYLAGERAWHRFLRGTGVVVRGESGAELRRWVGDFRPCYLLPLARLWGTQSMVRLDRLVDPPLDQAVTWSASISFSL